MGEWPRTARHLRNLSYMKRLITAVLACGLGFCVAPCFGVGFRLPNQDPEAIARGNAFIATADNPSAIYYNPAGITQLEGHHAQVGLYSIAASSRYRSLDGRRSKTDFEIQGVPQVYYTFSPVDNPLSFGLGLYAPYGLGLLWPEDSGFRTLSMEGRLAYVSLNPVIAWQVHPTLSLAIGPTVNAGKVKLRQGIAMPGDEFRFKGEGIDFGFTAGLRWQPHEQWAFGVSYRSATEIDFSGRSEARPYAPSERTKGELHFPQFVMIGLSYRPTPRWNIEAFVDWTDWDALNDVIFRKASGDVPFPFRWESSLMYGLGVTRHLNRGYWVSAGYFFSENSVPDATFNPAVPDTDQHVGSLGFGNRGPKWSWALGYQLLTGSWRTVTGGPISAAGESPDGRYKIFNNALNMSVGYRF
jgi:long-chain fatty acid transport protein